MTYVYDGKIWQDMFEDAGKLSSSEKNAKILYLCRLASVLSTEIYVNWSHVFNFPGFTTRRKVQKVQYHSSRDNSING